MVIFFGEDWVEKIFCVVNSQAPPIRLLILGPRGSGKSLNAAYLAEKLGIFHICYRERLQEMIIAKTKKKIGPEFEEDTEESFLEERYEEKSFVVFAYVNVFVFF